MLQDSTSSTLIQALGLDSPPVALAFVDGAAAEARTPQLGSSPACSFWRRAEVEVFYADAASHRGCPVGAMVMGFDLPPQLSEELSGLMGEMIGRDYLDGQEAAHVPTRKGAHSGILYGPLAAFPRDPDIIVCWLTPSQAMIWNEAAGGARWSAKPAGSVFGRPACAALPHGMTTGRPVLSFGCIGMRTFTAVANDRLLAVIPGGQLEPFVSELARMRRINDGMQSIYEARKADLKA